MRARAPFRGSSAVGGRTGTAIAKARLRGRDPVLLKQETDLQEVVVCKFGLNLLLLLQLRR